MKATCLLAITKTSTRGQIFPPLYLIYFVVEESERCTARRSHTCCPLVVPWHSTRNFVPWPSVLSTSVWASSFFNYQC